MRNLSIVILGVIVLLALGLYMITYQVNYNEVAVVTTFGSAEGDDAVVRGSPEAEGTGGWLGNLHFKWISPIQSVYTYDARVQTLDTRLEEMQTADKQAIIPSVFVAWQIDDPLAFYRSFLDDVDEAERQLEARLRDAVTQLSNYSFDQLTNSDSEQLMLDEAESAIRENLQTSLNRQGYGIGIKTVGVRRILLPQSVTEDVFSRMRATRERIAADVREEGNATASRITSTAQTMRTQILSFADTIAADIRAEGTEAVARISSVFKQDEEFAAYRRKLETLRQTLGSKTTIVADPRIMPFDEFMESHEVSGAGGNAANSASSATSSDSASE